MKTETSESAKLQPESFTKLLPPDVVLQFLIADAAQIRGVNCHVSSSLRCWKLWQRIARALLVQSLLDLKRAAGIRVRGDGKANDRYTGGFRRWPYGEGDGGRASSGSIQNSSKYACVWPIVQVRRVA